MDDVIRAFDGDAMLKKAVLDEIAERPEIGGIWNKAGADQEDVLQFCETYRLSPAFFHLVQSLGGAKTDEYADSFIKALFSALPLSADTRAIVVDWLFWLWDTSGARSLSRELAGTEALAPATAIMARHRLDGGASRKDWRLARSALLSIEGLNVAQRGAVDTVAAMGWSLDTTPATTADVVSACFNAARAKLGQRLNWTEEDAEANRAATTRVYSEAMREVGPRPETTDRDILNEYMAKVRAIVPSKTVEAEAQIMKRSEEYHAAMVEMSAQLTAEMRRDLLGLVNAPEKAAITLS